jgi:hypothetical protein
MSRLLAPAAIAASLLLLVGLLSFSSCKRSSTEPQPDPENLVTFRGRAFLAGQPAPVNVLHLPLHYDIEIISLSSFTPLVV